MQSGSPSSSFSLPRLIPPEIDRRRSKSTVAAQQRSTTIKIDHYRSISSGNGAETASIDGSARPTRYRYANHPLPGSTAKIDRRKKKEKKSEKNTSLACDLLLPIPARSIACGRRIARRRFLLSTGLSMGGSFSPHGGKNEAMSPPYFF
ncbi:hypothetical protein B296_00058482 [Ensete ventricosum]|uniref:Uncharacterized protein n=1 Tax=Ensete ventricosum TaxID=4639 RepID=A0A426XM96_ENSVE|nr:hypothetical protein B296_00058482 [Ensete ventricosum]